MLRTLALFQRCWPIMVGLVATLPVRSVMVFGTGDPFHNTTPPTGPLENSGWQWQGEWYGFLGTVIGPHHFITARHVSGEVGVDFIFRGQRYRTTAAYPDDQSDLRIWRVCGTFPDFAPLYDQSGEVGQPLVVIGRGTQRGEPVFMDSTSDDAELRGWRWGPVDFRRRWGTNHVDRVVKNSGGADYLAVDFDADGGGDEAHLSGGDSGGALFIKDGEQWKLAGINSAVDGPFNTTSEGTGFSAALFDARGFYLSEGGTWQLLPATGKPLTSEFYSTRISPRVEWIRSILTLPEPPDETPVLLSASKPEGPFSVQVTVPADEASPDFIVPLTEGARFFRVQSSCPRAITSVRTENGNLVITVE